MAARLTLDNTHYTLSLHGQTLFILDVAGDGVNRQ